MHTHVIKLIIAITETEADRAIEGATVRRKGTASKSSKLASSCYSRHSYM